MSQPSTRSEPIVHGRPLSFTGLIGLGRRHLFPAILTAVLSAAFSLVPLWLIAKIAAELFAPHPDADAVFSLALWALASLAVRWALMAISHVGAHKGAFDVQHRLRVGMARRLGQMPMSYFSGRGSGELRRVLNEDVNALEGFLAHILPDAVAAAAVSVCATVLLLFVDWPLALVALAPLPLAMLAQRWMMRRSADRMREWGELQKHIANQIGEYVRGVRVVKTFGLSAQSFGKLAATVRGAAEWVAGYARTSSTGWVLFTTLLGSGIVLVATFGGWRFRQGSISLETYVLFLLVAPAVLLPLMRLMFAFGEQTHRAQSLERINELRTAPVLPETTRPRVPGDRLDIEFDSVTHVYGARRALDAVSFTAAAGSLTAVVGPSGSGKSTLARMILRLYDPIGGAVRIAGVDVRDWPLDALLARIGMVFQDVHLFNGSVLDNLRIARPDASLEDVEKAARAASAHAFISALPDGYDTMLGERGARLSGGELQRLSIARALLKDAPILVLDEATSYADAENEAQIQQALAKLCRGRTVLMIAHRLRTIMHADWIVVMDDGQLVGQGVHDALLEEVELYRQLWRDHEHAGDWSLANADSDTTHGANVHGTGTSDTINEPLRKAVEGRNA